MTDYKALADLILPDVELTPQDMAERYPARQLQPGAMVTRFAPSPTGFLHIGGLFTAMISRRAAQASGGIFYLRIEDTDKKREVDGGVELIVKGLCDFGLAPDEGFTQDGEKGGYGPYKQSLRRDIYRVYAKSLMEQGMAYPCFYTEDELAEIRAQQESEKATTGIYGKWAKYRDITVEQAKQFIDEGKSFVVRLKSPGDQSRRISFKDAVKGKIEMPENEQDVVILKADGVPTYHFAHAIDDHLMGTTHVIRGDEWISSAPTHLQLFRALGFKPPVYAHVSPIMKEENGGKRKLSKRKDPEAAVSYYHEQGYPMQSVIEYLMTIANSNFEDWRRANPREDSLKFPFKMNKMSLSGALFDLVKLYDVSKNVISLMPAETVYGLALQWARQYDPDFADIFGRDRQYGISVLNIDREIKKPRKDIGKWSEVKDYVSFMYDELFEGADMSQLPENIDPDDAKAAIEKYIDIYDPNQDKNDWFNSMKDVAEQIGFAREVKEYKQNPDQYKGHVGDISTIVRIAVTGRRNTPDLCSIMQIMGKERVISRLKAFIG